MPKTIIKIKTWRCPGCDYSQDFDPNNAEKMAENFPGLPIGKCPACLMGKNPTKIKGVVDMEVETNSDKKATITIMGEDEVDSKDISNQEKQAMKDKVRADIIKFRALED